MGLKKILIIQKAAYGIDISKHFGPCLKMGRKWTRNPKTYNLPFSIFAGKFGPFLAISVFRNFSDISMHGGVSGD